nr:ribonuclease H-like domain-containing protein [Tanacetum cinerariifolium]
MHKAFPLLVIKFPLAEEVPTASVEGCHCQKKSEATARKIALLSKFWIQQYLQHEHYALWEVIEFDDLYVVPINTTDTTGGDKSGRTLTLTAEDMQRKKNDVKARTTLLLSLPDEHQLRFSKWVILQESAGLPEARTEKEETTSDREDHALVANEVAPTEIALMANTSAESKVFYNSLCSKDCKKNNDSLNRYTVVPPLTAQLYLSPKKDLSWTGLPECADDTVTDYSRPSPTVESISEDDQNRNTFFFETVASPITSKPFIKFVKPKDSQSNSKTDKKETPKKPPVKNYSPVNRKFSTGSRNFPTANRKLLTATRKFPIGTTKSTTADMGIKGKAVKPSACWFWRPSQDLSNKGPKNNSVSVMFKKYTYIDTQGRLKHMTGNISYLSDFEPYDGGYVSFGQGGCKITGKGIIKTGKLEFENVYFVKDLKYNLFSVSQICDNKNSVLFTDSECIVLGRDFKLLDNASILLRTPRQHNMYSINLNNIVPHRDLTCVVAKASADECMLWHRRLGHLNFKTMNKLVGHNLVRGLPNKCFENDHTCTACLKGKQHKASSRTMLADAKLPVTFWAKAVNTACYVQNRVLINKSHNKTPYELFNGRSSAIEFFKPFGCHVMILNTLDNLGKFEEKGDEGYFIGYSMSSKAFRVFNKRTRRVEENLHVKFLENKAIKKGAGPNWLFDIDSLTKSMNYVPVDAGTISTNLSDTKDATSQEVKKDVSFLRYIALPN